MTMELAARKKMKKLEFWKLIRLKLLKIQIRLSKKSNYKYHNITGFQQVNKEKHLISQIELKSSSQTAI